MRISDWSSDVCSSDLIMLTEQTAKTMFGDADPMGKVITHYGNDTTSYTVTGIIANVPENSQLQFDGLLSFNTLFTPDMANNWGGNWLNTYLERSEERRGGKEW